jgi:hypothetical protein
MAWPSSAAVSERADILTMPPAAVPARPAESSSQSQPHLATAASASRVQISPESQLAFEAMRALDVAMQTNLDQSDSAATLSSLSIAIGIGVDIDTLDIELGNWSGPQSTFVPNPQWPKASVNAGTKDISLERVRDRINAAGVGVLAVVVSDATGSRLLLRAKPADLTLAHQANSLPGEQSGSAFGAAGAAYNSKLLAQYGQALGPNELDMPGGENEPTRVIPSAEG